VTYNGSLLELRYYDPQERPVKVNGCELMRGEIGPRNKLLSITCLDAEGRVAVSAAGFATARMKYDEQGHQLEAAYFDQSDRPVLYQGKYAVIRNKVDEGGHEVERAYLGTDGKLHQLPDGYAIERMVYDSQGRLGQKTLYGDDAQLVGRIAYDPVGHETEHAYFKSGRLQMTSWGYAVLRAAYDDAGAPLVNTFFNEREQLIARCPPSHERGEFVPSHGCISADSRPVVTRPIVVKVDPQSKAERIGLQAGDLIESYDGREVFRPAELIQLVRESGAGSHKLTLRRGDRKLEFTIEQGRLGIGIDTRFQTEPGPQAANASGPGQ